MRFFLWGSGPWHAGEGRSPEGNRKTSRNQGSELSNATIVLQSDVVADVTCGEDNLIPGRAAGTATPVGIPVCCWRTRKTEGWVKSCAGERMSTNQQLRRLVCVPSQQTVPQSEQHGGREEAREARCPGGKIRTWLQCRWSCGEMMDVRKC